MNDPQAAGKDYLVASEFPVRIEGQGALFRHLTLGLGGLEIPATHSTHPLLTVKVIPGPRRTLVDRFRTPEAALRASDLEVTLTYRGRSMRFSATTMDRVASLEFDEYFDPQAADKLFELFLRRHLAPRGIALVHAAAVVGRATNHAHMYAATGGAGKTTWAIEHIGTRDYSLLGDDRVWLSEDGMVSPYPRYLVLKAGDSSAQARQQFSALQRGRGRASRLLLRKIAVGNGHLRRLLKWLITPNPVHVSPAAMFGSDSIAARSPLHSLRVGDQVLAPGAGEIECAQAACQLMQISWTEWDGFLSNVLEQHDRQVDEGRWSQELRDIRAAEERTVIRAIRCIAGRSR